MELPIEGNVSIIQGRPHSSRFPVGLGELPGGSLVKPPELPREMLLRYTDVPEGRIRTRVLGEPHDGVPPVVVLQGMTVSDYLLPACSTLAQWTQVHLLDLPGYAGSGQPNRSLDVSGYGET